MLFLYLYVLYIHILYHSTCIFDGLPRGQVSFSNFCCNRFKAMRGTDGTSRVPVPNIFKH